MQKIIFISFPQKLNLVEDITCDSWIKVELVEIGGINIPCRRRNDNTMHKNVIKRG